jgi:hypothetical protein
MRGLLSGQYYGSGRLAASRHYSCRPYAACGTYVHWPTSDWECQPVAIVCQSVSAHGPAWMAGTDYGNQFDRSEP